MSSSLALLLARELQSIRLSGVEHFDTPLQDPHLSSCLAHFAFLASIFEKLYNFVKELVIFLK